jgi:zinc transport system permease protein
MEVWYTLGGKMPFSWTEHQFMLNALLAVLLVAPLFGMLGTMVVNNRMAFFSDTIGHSALTGIGIGVIMGLNQPLWAMIIFAVFMAVTISLLKEYTLTSTDTVIGVFSAVAVAAGIVILSRGGGFNKYSSYLIGDLLSISPEEIKILFIVSMIFLGYWFYSFNSLLLLSISPSLARSRGINVRLVEIAFTVALAVIVTVSIQWIGIMIINSLLVLPAAPGPENLCSVKSPVLGRQPWHLQYPHHKQ